MPTDIILYAVIAAGLLFWLWNILGTRHGDEHERPNPFTDNTHETHERNGSAGFDSDSRRSPKSALFDGSDRDGESVATVRLGDGGIDALDLPQGGVIDSRTVENTLETIMLQDETFDPGVFLRGARAAFTMIVEAFARGDLEALRPLLTSRVYDSFAQAIKDREARGETVETKVRDVSQMSIVDADMKGRRVYLSVRFTAQESCAVYDRDGKLVSGDPDQITEMVDVWVFGRDINSEEPGWLLYETRDDEQEDNHKTPIPETMSY